MSHVPARFDVIGLGGAAWDSLAVVARYPRYRSKVEGLELQQQPGGQVPTALVALSRWGRRVAYAGQLGPEPESTLSLQALRRDGVDVSRARLDPGARTQVSLILIDSRHGERTIVWNRAGGALFRAKDLRPGAVEDARVLLLDGYDPVAPEAAKRARGSGALVVLDAERKERWTRALLRHTDVLIACEEFPRQMVEGASLLARLRALQELGPGIVAVTLGRRGAVALAASGQVVRGPALKVRVKDTTGAGDVFHAAWIHGLLEGWDVGRCLAFGNVMAGLKCRSLGGRPGIAPLEEGLRRLRRYSVARKPSSSG